ncbi:MAG: NfeD family protein [Nitratireductor sp.]|nr:NfeD family protein [Nitratireductor sp.]MCB1457582.1 NfeD family protein [Nitratireductor sp.]MCB1458326.1 NfeD family protein [Nitratireductor sp.]
MIQSIVHSLGPWNWWILALVLLGLEVLAPGTFFLWFGISAFVIGTISLAMGPDSSFWVWQTQMIGFVVLSLVAAVIGRRFMNQYRLDDSDNTDLNDRIAQMVGRTGTLNEAISGGTGRVKIGETTWRVSGPELPVGTRVRVVGHHAGQLDVAAEE